jgi:hypothetical protein
MTRKKSEQPLRLEIILILICLALCGLLDRVGLYRSVVLNLFYLPVVLAAFYLGRYRAGILALFCVISAAVITALHLNSLVVFTSPLAVGLALTIWGAVMGMNSLLVGTLSDERMEKIKELHDAYVGVVEVLARYLNSSDPRTCDHTAKVAQLSQDVATQMRLSDKEVDDIRVAALLQDMENIEITARVIRKAVGDLAPSGRKKQMEHTFHGSELVQSLGSVLTGALPLLGNRGEYPDLCEEGATRHAPAEHGFGPQIIHTVRAYVTLLNHDPSLNSHEALDMLENGLEGNHHLAVIHAIEQVVLHAGGLAARHAQAATVMAGNSEPMGE